MLLHIQFALPFTMVGWCSFAFWVDRYCEPKEATLADALTGLQKYPKSDLSHAAIVGVLFRMEAAFQRDGACEVCIPVPLTVWGVTWVGRLLMNKLSQSCLIKKTTQRWQIIALSRSRVRLVVKTRSTRHPIRHRPNELNIWRDGERSDLGLKLFKHRFIHDWLLRQLVLLLQEPCWIVRCKTCDSKYSWQLPRLPFWAHALGACPVETFFQTFVSLQSFCHCATASCVAITLTTYT